MWSAWGTRIRSVTMPPHGPLAGPKPYAARVPRVVGAHLEVSPARQRWQVPQETAQGTTTVWPIRIRRTPDPTATTSATHSWPIGKGPWKGIFPQMAATIGSTRPSAIPACSARETGRWIGRVSPSQRPARNGRTTADRKSVV